MAFLAGIFLASLISISFETAFLLAAFSLILWRLYLKLRRATIPSSILAQRSVLFMALAAIFFGMASFSTTQKVFGPSDLAFYNDSSDYVEITGLIADPPIQKDSYTELRVQAEQLEDASTFERIDISGGILVRTSDDQDWAYGDRVLIRGFLESAPVFEDFSYRSYLSRQGIDSMLSFAKVIQLQQGQGNPILISIFSFRAAALQQLKTLFPEPEAALFAGILLGDESGLSASLKDDFNETGTRHVIAISGFNITIIAGILIAFFRRSFGPLRGNWLAIIGILIYTILVGADAAVVRAAIMGTLALLARQSGRRQAGLLTLSLSAALMALFNPLILWDVGFQLSFTATLGLILYANPLSAWAEKHITRLINKEFAEKIRHPLSDFVLLTIAAQITTFPLILYHFHRLSWSSLPANLLILPAQPGLMILGGLALILSFIFLPLAQLTAWIAWPFAAFTIRIVELFAQPAWSSAVLGDLSSAFVLTYYFALAFLTFRPSEENPRRFSFRPIAIALSLAAIALWIWMAAFSAPSGELQITILDVGTGEAILLRTPNGRNILINGGESRLALGEELGRTLPYFKNDLDWLIIAGVETKQIAALPDSVERFAPAKIAWSGNPSASSSARRVRQAADSLDIPIAFMSPGQVFDLGQGAELELLGTTDQGAVLLLRFKNFRFLLPIGLDQELIKDLDWGKAIGRVTGILLSEGGKPDSNPQMWLDNLAAEFHLISANALDRNAYKFESSHIPQSSSNLLSTMTNGWIRITTDGDSYWLETDR